MVFGKNEAEIQQNAVEEGLGLSSSRAARAKATRWGQPGQQQEAISSARAEGATRAAAGSHPQKAGRGHASDGPESQQDKELMLPSVHMG